MQTPCAGLVAQWKALQGVCKHACKTGGVNGLLELRVLGPIEVTRAGQAIAIGGAQPRLVLAMLAAWRGSVVSTERLCEELWPDDAPGDPAGALQSIVSRLRRTLRPEAEIVARPPGYGLELGEECIDADRFEGLCARGGACRRPPTRDHQPQGCARMLAWRRVPRVW